MDKASRDYFDLCEESKGLIFIVSPGGELRYVNPALRQRLGYDRQELSRMVVQDLLTVENLPVWDAVVRKLTPASARADLRICLQAKNGQVIPAAGSVSCRFEGSSLSALRIRLHAMAQEAPAERDLNRLFNLSLDLLCVAGTDGFFKQINPAFERVLGYQEEELLSRSFLDFVHPDDQSGTVAAVERLASGLPVVDFQNRYLARDGTYRWLAWRSAPWAERGLIFAVARDITEQKRIQEVLSRQAEELLRSNQDLEQFAWVASHDLRAPLRAIANLSEWIEEDIPGELSPKVQENLKRLRSQVRRMEAMTDDLLEFARVSQRTSEICEVDVPALIGGIIQLLSPPEGIRVAVDPRMPTFRTARSALEQVFRNLISNAIKHHDRDSGEISVGVVERDRHFQFDVRDDGPGIPEEFHEEVFKMFRRLQARDKVEGTGIGLPLVKRIVEGYGGKIWLESAGRGAVFFFEWPKQVEAPGDA